MSRYDLRFTAAMRSYDQSFNLADGGSTLGFRYIGTADPEKYYLKDEDGSSVKSDIAQNPPQPHVIGVIVWMKAAANAVLDAVPYNCLKEAGKTKYTCTRCVDRTGREYTGSIQFIGYTTDLKEIYGEDVSAAECLLFWTAGGAAERAGTAGAFKTGNSTIQMSATKLMKD